MAHSASRPNVQAVKVAACLCLAMLLLTACSTQDGTTPRKPASDAFDPRQLAKTDIDRVAEAHQRAIFADLKILAEKLYRRNPREWRKAGHPSVEVAVARIFEGMHGWQFPELDGKRGTDVIHLAFKPEYQGDRVLAFIAGLGSMMQSAFHDKTELFLLDDLEPQGLSNAARNVEIAVWKLSNARDAQGTLILLSNEGAGAAPNLSFEREFGKIIGNLDLLSAIIADKGNRTVVKIIQNLATAVFLPIHI